MFCSLALAALLRHFCLCSYINKEGGDSPALIYLEILVTDSRLEAVVAPVRLMGPDPR
jgi:hypothetical protein